MTFGIDSEGFDKRIAFAGNPNVGKSTIFNTITGLHQHTGNWPGKTVELAAGTCEYRDHHYLFVDLPGTYSLMAHSSEEEVARDYICFGEPDVTVVVCDATCIERNLNLVLQTLEMTKNVIVCVNLLDEAKRKKIHINLEALSTALQVPVIGTNATRKIGIDTLLDTIHDMPDAPYHIPVTYPENIEQAIGHILPSLETSLPDSIHHRWVAVRLLDKDTSLLSSLQNYLSEDTLCACETTCLEDNSLLSLSSIQMDACKYLEENFLSDDEVKDTIVSSIMRKAASISSNVITSETNDCHSRDRKIDRILTSRIYGTPIMIFLLLCIFWITISGANVPSGIIYDGLFYIGGVLSDTLFALQVPAWVESVLIQGIYRVLAWVVSVMLPPMAIFFPLFTLLEDLGYLPRVAFNLDHCFKKANACGKQALTMCMGFGCNAAGVIGCRIIDSPRERMIAILTNTFVPCNGRFPTIISIITMFFLFGISGITGSILSTLLLTGVILVGIVMTLFISRLLSATLLRGVPSSFTLELPPYRKPQIGKVIVRSVLDRTLFVLGRAIVIAAPAGLIIWLFANIYIGDLSILKYCTNFLDPLGSFIGLDGTILMAFILGFPANEIVIPILIMAYLNEGSILEMENVSALKNLLVSNGWTLTTALCFLCFSLMHWPCSTTMLTIYKETKSMKWTVLAFLLPTLCGIILCICIKWLYLLFA